MIIFITRRGAKISQYSAYPFEKEVILKPQVWEVVPPSDPEYAEATHSMGIFRPSTVVLRSCLNEDYGKANWTTTKPATKLDYHEKKNGFGTAASIYNSNSLRNFMENELSNRTVYDRNMETLDTSLDRFASLECCLSCGATPSSRRGATLDKRSIEAEGLLNIMQSVNPSLISSALISTCEMRQCMILHVRTLLQSRFGLDASTMESLCLLKSTAQAALMAANAVTACVFPCVF
eukprot:PhF_6_TR4500/c0_g1_i6/m.6248